MDYGIETSFVSRCVKKEYRERLLFELQSPKKREKALSRFAHACEGLLQSGYQIIKTSDLQHELLQLAQENAICYIIGGDLYDGQSQPLAKASEMIKDTYMPVILIVDSFIAIKPEIEAGESRVYLYKI